MNVKLEMEHEHAVDVLSARITEARATVLAVQNGYQDDMREYSMRQQDLYDLLWGVVAMLGQAQGAFDKMIKEDLASRGLLPPAEARELAH